MSGEGALGICFPFPVEAGHVLMFRRAIGDPDAGLDDPQVPLTFLQAGNHFDPTWPFRPRLDGTTSSPEDVRHVGESQSSTRSLRVGEVLTVRRMLPHDETKMNRRGEPRTFRSVVTEYLDADGSQVARATSVGIVVPPGTGGVSRSPSDPNENNTVGAGRQVLTEEVSRAQIVQYAGASGDFNPVHIDEPYATVEVGLPSVIAPGMLTAAMSFAAIERTCRATVTSYDVRFHRPVMAGDSVSLSHRASAGVGARRIELVAEGPAGVVLTGSVDVRAAGEDIP